MVCLIQKLFGRDENSRANEQPDLLSSLEIDCSGTAHRPCQTEQPVDNVCLWSNCPNRRPPAKTTPSESDGLPHKNASPQSHQRSRSLSVPAWKGAVEIGGRVTLANQDASSAPKLTSPCSSSSSLSWSCLEPMFPSLSEDVLSCSRQPVSHCSVAEPVCCCDECTYILDSTPPFIALQHTLPCSVPPPPDYDQVIGYTGHVLPPHVSAFMPSASGCCSSSSSRSCIKSESTNTSSAAMRLFYYEKTPHRTKQQQQHSDIQSLPPMISMSPDGEEGFANSQHILQRGQHHNPPFCEVPPNKTICHVHWKSINSK